MFSLWRRSREISRFYCSARYTLNTSPKVRTLANKKIRRTHAYLCLTLDSLRWTTTVSSYVSDVNFCLLKLSFVSLLFTFNGAFVSIGSLRKLTRVFICLFLLFQLIPYESNSCRAHLHVYSTNETPQSQPYIRGSNLASPMDLSCFYYCISLVFLV